MLVSSTIRVILIWIFKSYKNDVENVMNGIPIICRVQCRSLYVDSCTVLGKISSQLATLIGNQHIFSHSEYITERKHIFANYISVFVI